MFYEPCSLLATFDMPLNSAFDMEMTFHSHTNKTHFHKKGCALGLILKVRVFGTRKWPILPILVHACVTDPYSGINIFTGFPEKMSPGWLIFHYFYFGSCVSPIKAKRDGRPYIFTAIKPLQTFYISL